jgi:DMSO/TMAO reductase YedYZ molybdopterin-dependent catalytic subunit
VSVVPPRRLALAGAVTGLAGVAAAHALTAALNARATPVQVVAEVVIVKTPGPVAEAFIQLVGRKDKPILVATVTLTIVLLGAVAGLLTARRRVLGHLVFWAMGLVALLAAMSRNDFTQLSLLPIALGVIVWTVLLDLLVSTARPSPSPELSRRRFLLTAGGVTLGALVLGASSRLLGRSRRAVETSRRLLRLPVTRGTVPDGVAPGPDTAPWRTPNPDFYRIDTALVVPAIDPVDWRLRIHGMVDREITLTYAELIQRSVTEAWVTICCVSNPVGGDLVGNAWWSGVRIADLLDEAGVRAGADAVKQTSEDGWTCGTPLQALTDDRNAMLAVAMNGAPLPLEHGFPVRMVIPGLYGYESACKWITEIEATTYEAYSAYWVRRGWAEQVLIKTSSRIDTPRDGVGVQLGAVTVAGVAWAQHRGISAVEIQLDGGDWAPARLAAQDTADTWRQWAFDWAATPGDHQLTVRATDGDGIVQTDALAPPFPDGSTGLHSIGVTVS